MTVMLRVVLGFMLGMVGVPAMADTAIVAGGCFWCVESDFEQVAGVSEVVSGYTGGDLQNPTYDNHDGHLEAVMITFDSSVISYEALMAKVPAVHRCNRCRRSVLRPRRRL